MPGHNWLYDLVPATSAVSGLCKIMHLLSLSGTVAFTSKQFLKGDWRWGQVVVLGWPEYVSRALVQSSESTVPEWAVSTIVSPHPVGPPASATAASSCRRTARRAKVCEHDCEGAGCQVG